MTRSTSSGESGTASSPPKRRGRAMAIAGLVLFTGPFWGMLVTVNAMSNAFGEAVISEEEMASETLSEEIGVALKASLYGLGVGLVGLILMLVAVYGGGNREKWFLWCSLILAVLWCLVMSPIGWIVGLVVGWVFLGKRREFR